MAKAFEDGKAMSISSVHFVSGRYHAVRKHLGKWLSFKITLLWAFCREISHGLDTALLRERVTLKRGKNVYASIFLVARQREQHLCQSQKFFSFIYFLILSHFVALCMLWLFFPILLELSTFWQCFGKIYDKLLSKRSKAHRDEEKKLYIWNMC